MKKEINGMKEGAGAKAPVSETVKKTKTWDNGKEDSYERNPGGVSFVLNLSFFELYKVRKNLFSLSKKLFSTG